VSGAASPPPPAPRGAAARATVAVASFQTLALLKVVLGAVRESAPAAEVIVVDTGSRDGTREWAARRAWLRLEALDGVAPGAAAHGAALDRALALAARPLFVALDSDAPPARADWLERLAAPLGEGAAACGTTKDPREVSTLRRLAARLAGRAPGPEWSYLRPNRAVYDAATLRALGLAFAGAPRTPSTRGAAVGERLARGLVEAGRRVHLLAPAAMDALVLHLRHATMALSPALFPGTRPRDMRAARRRIEAFLGTERARRMAEVAEEE
jgi:hypothetical protein